MENTNKFFPRNLLDFFHPYEYLFNHKIKNDSKNKELKLQLSDNNFNDNKTGKNLFNKKIKYFSRNKTHKLNITPINKTDIQKNSFKAKQNFRTERRSKSFGRPWALPRKARIALHTVQQTCAGARSTHRPTGRAAGRVSGTGIR